mmetsp:Transcript_59182/g.125808  ORF Transcript_59182/g.125808 Transcript_59182/m.125808 type:complete len:201 (+) Transcript_59182:738-1340(+)
MNCSFGKEGARPNSSTMGGQMEGSTAIKSSLERSFFFWCWWYIPTLPCGAFWTGSSSSSSFVSSVGLLSPLSSLTLASVGSLLSGLSSAAEDSIMVASSLSSSPLGLFVLFSPLFAAFLFTCASTSPPPLDSFASASIRCVAFLLKGFTFFSKATKKPPVSMSCGRHLRHFSNSNFLASSSVGGKHDNLTRLLHSCSTSS